MTVPQAGFERRVHGALEAAPSRIPVILGGCGTGRTWLLQRLRDRVGRQAAQYIDVERSATTPERFLQSVISSSPFPWHGADRVPANARDGVALVHQQLETLQQRIASHIKMKALHLAQVEFYDLMRKITQTIQKPLAEVSAGGAGGAGAPNVRTGRGM